MTQLIRVNSLERRPYAEPFAGGCGLALGLLYNGVVSELHLNDLDPAIWAFWHSVIEHTDEFCNLIELTDVTVAEWRRQRCILDESDIQQPVKLGFAAFFLNRTSRSGIIKGSGVIGGLKQNGNYKIDCRYNKIDLVERVKRVSKYGKRISLTNMDAIDFLDYFDKSAPKRSTLCIDPPYFNQGSNLYTNFYRAADHAALARRISDLRRPWIVTYDNCPEIAALYHGHMCYEFSVNYSVQTKRRTNELLVASPGMLIDASGFTPMAA